MKRRLILLLALIALLILILDPTTAQQGAVEGITLCIQAVIPSLFPFLVLSVILIDTLQCCNYGFINCIGNILRFQGGEALYWLIGLLGGYPIGARSIADGVKESGLTIDGAERLLCFCCNAGPAFIFGLGIHLFGDLRYALLVWGIHILSSIIMSILAPGKSHFLMTNRVQIRTDLSLAVKYAVQSMGMICGWVVMFRIMIAILSRRIFHYVPDDIAVIISGVLELTNGCMMLQSCSSFTLRLVLLSAFLGFGGLCVTMQTHTVLSGTGLRFSIYLPAKITQAAISVILASITSMVCFPEEKTVHLSWIFVSALVVIAYILVYHKKTEEITLSFPGKLRYNHTILHKR